MAEPDLQKKDFRIERKFVVPYLDTKETEAVVLSNSFLFREIFYQRQNNNIYFDDIDMTSYFDNILGNTDRTKVRIRWYGDFESVTKPVLELKIKRGLAGTKLMFPLASFLLPCSIEEMQRVFDQSNLPTWVREKLKSQRYSLVNYYKRKYFMSACGGFRITIDSDLTYSGVLNQDFSLLQEIKDNYQVLELKHQVGERADQVASQFPFRLSKSSKYVAGINHFRGE